MSLNQKLRQFIQTHAFRLLVVSVLVMAYHLINPWIIAIIAIVLFGKKASVAIAVLLFIMATTSFMAYGNVEITEPWVRYASYFLMITFLYTLVENLVPDKFKKTYIDWLYTVDRSTTQFFKKKLPFLSFFEYVPEHRLWDRILLVTSLVLFFIPFFWFKYGQGDYGGDASRLYLVDPLAWLHYRAIWSIGILDFGFENPEFALIPFTTLLYVLKTFLFNNTELLLNILNGLLLSMAFISTYALTKDLHTPPPKASTRASAYFSGLFFVFSPILIFSWIKHLYRFHEIALYPLLAWLLLRFIQKKSWGYLLAGIALTAVFALNFSFHASPSLFSAWPFLLVILIVYALVHQRFIFFLKGLLVFGVMFLGLHAFHLIPQILAFTNTSGAFYQATFTPSGQIDQGLHYFEGIRPIVRLSYNLARLPQYLLYTTTAASPEFLQILQKYGLKALPVLLLFSALILAGLLLSTSQNNKSKQTIFIVTTGLFLISLFLMTANMFGSYGPKIYSSFFRIPGFTMFRSFYGVFSFIFALLYAVTVGFSLRFVLSRVHKPLFKILIVCILLIPVIYSAWPFINGQVANISMPDAKSLPYAHRFSQDFTDTLEWIKDNEVDAKFLSFPLTHYNYQVIDGQYGGAYVGPSPISLLAGKGSFSGISSFEVQGSALFNREFITDRLKQKDVVTLNRLFSLMNINFILLNRSPLVYEQTFTGYPYSQELFRSFPSTQDFIQLAKHLGYAPVYEKGVYTVYHYPDSFLPHFYTPRTIVKRSNPEEFKQYLISKEGYDIRTAFYRLDTPHDEIIKNIPDHLLEDSLPLIQFHKINPTQYRLQASHIKQNFPLIFSNVFHTGWKLIPVPVSSIDDSKFKNNNGTIQNDTLPSAYMWSSWGEKAVDEMYHIQANEYANSWYVDVAYLQKNFPDLISQNTDGTYNAEFLVEFKPQHGFYIGTVISILTATGLSMALFIYKRRYARVAKKLGRS